MSEDVSIPALEGSILEPPKPWTRSPLCHAKSKQTGMQCQRPAIPGGTVCRHHGGAAKAAQRKARMRLAELVDPAIATLAREMATASTPKDRLAAANSILDRTGYGRSQKVEGVDARTLLLERLLELADSYDEGVRGVIRDATADDDDEDVDFT